MIIIMNFTLGNFKGGGRTPLPHSDVLSQECEPTTTLTRDYKSNRPSADPFAHKLPMITCRIQILVKS